MRWRYTSATTDRLEIAPKDLRTADPTLASEIYGGRFAFAGKVVICDRRSPFEMLPPSDEWAVDLLSFAWLRHLRAADFGHHPRQRALADRRLDQYPGPLASARLAHRHSLPPYPVLGCARRRSCCRTPTCASIAASRVRCHGRCVSCAAPSTSRATDCRGPASRDRAHLCCALSRGPVRQPARQRAQAD